MAEINNLKNITPFEFNSSRLGTGEEIPLNVINYAKDNLVAIWIDTVMLSIFLFILFHFSNKTDPTSYTNIKAICIASILCFVLTSGLLLSGFSKNIYPLFLYGTIMMFSSFIVYSQKKKGL